MNQHSLVDYAGCWQAWNITPNHPYVWAFSDAVHWFLASTPHSDRPLSMRIVLVPGRHKHLLGACVSLVDCAVFCQAYNLTPTHSYIWVILWNRVLHIWVLCYDMYLIYSTICIICTFIWLWFLKKWNFPYLHILISKLRQNYICSTLFQLFFLLFCYYLESFLLFRMFSMLASTSQEQYPALENDPHTFSLMSCIDSWQTLHHFNHFLCIYASVLSVVLWWFLMCV